MSFRELKLTDGVPMLQIFGESLKLAEIVVIPSPGDERYCSQSEAAI